MDACEERVSPDRGSDHGGQSEEDRRHPEGNDQDDDGLAQRANVHFLGRSGCDQASRAQAAAEGADAGWHHGPAVLH